jgi:hypothetical protein
MRIQRSGGRGSSLTLCDNCQERYSGGNPPLLIWNPLRNDLIHDTHLTARRESYLIAV